MTTPFAFEWQNCDGAMIGTIQHKQGLYYGAAAHVEVIGGFVAYLSLDGRVIHNSEHWSLLEAKGAVNTAFARAVALRENVEATP